MNYTRTGIVILLSIYLIGLGFFLNAIAPQFNDLDYKYTGQTLGTTFMGNIVLSITSLPLWFNTMFIIIPSVMLIVFALLLFIPTTTS